MGVVCKHIAHPIVIDVEEHLKKNRAMKEENKSTHNETDKSKERHEYQNIHDFDPSQFTTEEELEKIKWEKEKARKEEKNKLKDKEK